MFKKFWEWLKSLFATKKTEIFVAAPVDIAPTPNPIGFTKEKFILAYENDCAKGLDGLHVDHVFRPFYEAYPNDFGKSGWPWCGAQCYYALMKAGFDGPPGLDTGLTWAYVPAIITWAKSHGFYYRNTNGFQAQRGDIGFIDWTGDGSDDHVVGIRASLKNGLYLTAEGNSGNQQVLANRAQGLFSGFCRIPDGYSTKVKSQGTTMKQEFDTKPGFDLIKSFEGCYLTAYPDPGPTGLPLTIGWGHTGADVYNGLTITQAKADELFDKDMAYFVNGVLSIIPVNCTQGQFGALVSFAYNCGLGALKGSTLLKLFLLGDVEGAADEFLKWTRAGGIELPGLVRRRKAEREMFLS